MYEIQRTTFWKHKTERIFKTHAKRTLSSSAVIYDFDEIIVSLLNILKVLKD